MAGIAARYMTTFTIQLIVRYFCNLHKPVIIFIPMAHALSGIVKAVAKKGGKTCLLLFGRQIGRLRYTWDKKNEYQ
jgi:hypothetical protein